MIHRTVATKGAKRDWVLDADLKSAFDKIDHNFLLERLGTFPAREQVHDWLKAGVVDKGQGFSPTEEGTPQGGLCNAFHNPPYEQRRVMRSAGLLALVTATLSAERCA